MTRRSHAGDARSTGRDLQAQMLDTVRKSQEVTVEAIRAWAEAVQSIMPAWPSMLPALPGNLPQPEEIVANAYDFAEQLLTTQRQFAEDVFRATAPPAAKAGSPATRPAGSAAR
jgi:hypothetical protein